MHCGRKFRSNIDFKGYTCALTKLRSSAVSVISSQEVCYETLYDISCYKFDRHCRHIRGTSV